MEDASIIENKASLREGRQEFWLQKAEIDEQRILRGEANLRDVLRDWAKQLYEEKKKSKVDALTGVFSRGAFEETLPRIIDFCRKNKTTLGMMIFDIDNFKTSINDKHGHPFGDAVLKKVGTSFFHSVREGDHPARYGGEEFVALLPGVDVQDIAMIGERTRTQIEMLSFEEEGKPEVKVTVSVGVSLLRDDDSIKSFLQRTDRAAYQAKQSGKNKVCVLLEG